MTIREACHILGISDETDFREIKKRYRQLMLQVHPDTGNLSGGARHSRAQEINLAYSILKRSLADGTFSSSHKEAGDNRQVRSDDEKESPLSWNAPVNGRAYREREILHYAEDSDGSVLGSFCIARGKYLWITEEDFPLFLLSIYRCGRGILDEIDDRLRRPEASPIRPQILAELVYLLAQQFIDGTTLLHELSGEKTLDKNGNPVFYLPAMLESSLSSPVQETGGVLYPSRMQKHRLYLKNQADRELGYLSFPDDRLYYVVIPLFEQRRAQVRIQFAEPKDITAGTGKAQSRQKKGAGGYRRLHLWIKLPPEREGGMPENLNLQIEQLLNRYQQSL